MRMRLALTAALAAACTAAPAPDVAVDPPVLPSAPASRLPSPPPPRVFDPARAFADVRALAALGPREATSAAYAEAAAIVRDRLATLGYEVEAQRLRVPAGESWGVPVRAGRTSNVIARSPSFDPARPWLVVGAHLDTVPQAPGADDNASGVAVMLELARLAVPRDLRPQVVFVAFAAEEPRAGGDDGHHYGSRAFVARLSRLERGRLLGAMSLDRVGNGRDVRVCTGGMGPGELAVAVLRSADALGIDARPCENRTSDHWSFERGGFDGVRLLGEDHPAYHTARDRPSVIERAQLARIGTIAWETLLRL